MVYGIYRDSLKVITEEVVQYCNKLGYRVGRELGRDFYSIGFESYWVDEDLEEVDLVVKIIDLVHKKGIMFTKSDTKLNDIKTEVKTIKVTVGVNKVIKIKTTLDRKFIPNYSVFRREIKELNRLSHQNLVLLKDILYFNDRKSRKSSNLSYVLMYIEFCNKNLKQKLELFYKKRQRNPTEDESVNWGTQIARGLAYLHSRGISSTNLKPSNILVFNNKLIKGGILLKISDFGLSMLFPIKQNETKTESDLYRDPVIDYIFSKLNDSKNQELSYDATKADIWSLAVIITQFVINLSQLFKLFRDTTRSENFAKVYLQRVAELGASQQLADLLSKMLKYEQKERLDIIGVCNHQWIANELSQQRKSISKQFDKPIEVKPKTTVDPKTDKNTSLMLNELSTINTQAAHEFGLKDNIAASDDE